MKSLTLPALMENFETMMEFVRSQSAAAGFDPSQVNKIALAGEELIVNVIHYAYPDSSGNLEIHIDHPPDQPGVRIVLIDEGVAFNPLGKEDPDINAPVEDRPIGGLGIFMVRKVMDEVSYSRDGNRNVLTMTKKTGGG